MVKRTERGWIGHFCCADRCLFRRNTLLEKDDVKIVVSTVGLMRDIHSHDEFTFEEIGIGRYFETVAFHSDPKDERYHDIDVSRPVQFNSNWRIEELDADDKANDMHEAVVTEITERLEGGEFNENL